MSPNPQVLRRQRERQQNQQQQAVRVDVQAPPVVPAQVAPRELEEQLALRQIHDDIPDLIDTDVSDDEPVGHVGRLNNRNEENRGR